MPDGMCYDASTDGTHDMGHDLSMNNQMQLPEVPKKKSGCGWVVFVLVLMLVDPPMHRLQVAAIFAYFLLQKGVRIYVGRLTKRAACDAEVLQFKTLCAECVALAIQAFCLPVLFQLRPMLLFGYGMLALWCGIVIKLVRSVVAWLKNRKTSRVRAWIPVVCLLLALGGGYLGNLVGKQVKLHLFYQRLPAYQRIVQKVAEQSIRFDASAADYEFQELPPEFSGLSPLLLRRPLIGQALTNNVVTVGIVTHGFGGINPILSGYLYCSSGWLTNSVFAEYPFSINRRINREWVEFSYHD